MNKWDERFLALAAHVAQWSKDPSTKTGAVLVDTRRRVLGVGYNGFARGVDDAPDRLNDRPMKLKLTVHAEANTILNASGNARGATMYLHPWPPCAPCAGLVIQAGIVHVIAPKPTPEQRERWGADFELMERLFEEANVGLYQVDGAVQAG
jgi:dCMP deaminase